MLMTYDDQPEKPRLPANDATPTRESILRDSRWMRLQQGKLSAQEEGELRALADTHGLYREAYDLFRPFSAEERASVLERARLKVADEQGRAPRHAEDAQPESPGVPSAPTDAPRLPTSRRLVLPVLAFALGVAAPALYAIAVGSQPGSPSPPTAPQTPAPKTAPARDVGPVAAFAGFAAYGVVAMVQDAVPVGSRASAAGLVQPSGRSFSLPRGKHIELTFLPQTAQTEDFSVHTFLRGPGGVEAWSPRSGGFAALTSTRSGVVAISGNRDDLFGERAGTWSVVVVLARPGFEPQDSSEWRDYLTGALSPPSELPVRIEQATIELLP